MHNHHPIHPMTLQLNSDCCSRCMSSSSSSSSCCTFNQYDWTLAGSRHQKDNQPATTQQQQQQPRNLIYFILKRHRHRRQPVVGGMGLNCLSSSPREARAPVACLASNSSNHSNHLNSANSKIYPTDGLSSVTADSLVPSGARATISALGLELDYEQNHIIIRRRIILISKPK